MYSNLPTVDDADERNFVLVKTDGDWFFLPYYAVEFTPKLTAWKPIVNEFNLVSVRTELARVKGLLCEAHKHGAILTTSFLDELERKHTLCLDGCTDC